MKTYNGHTVLHRIRIHVSPAHSSGVVLVDTSRGQFTQLGYRHSSVTKLNIAPIRVPGTAGGRHSAASGILGPCFRAGPKTTEKRASSELRIPDSYL